MKNRILLIIVTGIILMTLAISCSKPVTSVTLDKSILTLNIGETASLIATVLPEKATNKQITFSSNNPLVANVLPNGMVTGISKGNATIVVTTVDGNFSASCVVTVSDVSVTDVRLNKNTLALGTGEKELLIATVLPENATLKEVFWTVSNPYIATCINGTVTALQEGNAEITVTTIDGSKTASCALTVYRKVYVTGVDLNKTTLALGVGNMETLIAYVRPTNATNKNVTWKSSNIAVATVNSITGLVTAVAEGTATITVTTEESNYTATCVVTCVNVTPPVLTTLAATNITSSSAKLGGNITNVGNPAYTQKGICYSSTVSMPVYDPYYSYYIPVSGTGTGNFTGTADYLEPGTTYYARAYAITSMGITYGNVVTFKTLSAPITVAKVRFKKVYAFEYCTEMTVDNSSGTELAGYYFGTNAGTSPYYDISPGNHIPWFYYTYPGQVGWLRCLPSPYTYNFQVGKKYTVTADTEGGYMVFYVTDEGPAKSSDSGIPYKPQTTQIKIPKVLSEKPKADIKK